MSNPDPQPAEKAAKPKIEHSRLGEVRYPPSMAILIALSILVFAGVLYLTSYKNFYYDEWDFISTARPWNLNVLLLAHNEHWSTIPILIWKVLFVVVGIRSHIPYEAALLVAHVATVLLLFTLVRRRSGDLPALGAAIILLVFGTGGTDIVWAFQIGFVGSVAFGLLALVLLEGDVHFPRLLAASAALLCSVMCSSVGLAFVSAVAVQLLMERRRRRYLLVLVVPVLAFGAWFVAFGAGLPGSPGAPCPTCLPTGFGADVHRGPITVGFVANLATFVTSGLQATAAGILGFRGGGVVLLPILGVVVALHWYAQRRIAAWQMGATAGLLGWFTLVGLGRSQQGAGAVADPHYLYIGAVFLLPLLVDAASALPWRMQWRLAITTLLAVAVVGNAVQLRDAALSQIQLMGTENAKLQTVEVFRGAHDMALDRSLDDTIMPQLRAGPYLGATSELGSPVTPATLDSLRRLPWLPVDQEMVNLFGDAMRTNTDRGRPITGMPCKSIDSKTGTTVDLQVPDGQWIMLQSTKSGEALLFLSFLGPPSSGPLRDMQLMPSIPNWIYLPNTGRVVMWRLRIQTTAVGFVQVCGASSLQGDSPTGPLYGAEAESGVLDAGWSVVPDAAASAGHAAKLESGTQVVSFKNDSFGRWVEPIPGFYDVWYRVKVTSTAGATPEITLGLWDGTARTWVSSARFAPNQVGTEYSWVKVTTEAAPRPGHLVQYLATFNAQFGPATLSTNWYVDQAVMVPAGSAPPA